jgi:hypothetical protein
MWGLGRRGERACERAGALFDRLQGREMVEGLVRAMARVLDGLWLALVVAWALLISVADGVPHTPRSSGGLDCVATVREFAHRYKRSGCDRVLPFRLNVNELLADCMRGDSEDVRVVFSKLEEIGERAFAGDGACAARLDDEGAEGLPPPTAPLSTAR